MLTERIRKSGIAIFRSFVTIRESGRKFAERQEYLRNHFFKSIKIAIAAVLSIFLAEESGLESSVTAGIITILSIQDTKRETLRTVLRRGGAYLFGLLVAGVCFGIMGYTLPSFAVYLLVFAFGCMLVSLQEGITTATVLVSHMWALGSMELPVLLNETGILVIGSGMGILVNLHLRRKDADFERLTEDVDGQMKDILRYMAEWLPNPGRACDRVSCFQELEEAISKAEICAIANLNNSFRRRDTGDLEYIRMRRKQAVVLKGIYRNIMQIAYLPGQAVAIADFLGELERAYHKYNTVTEYLDKLQALKEQMEKEKLPETREEFEARAILFYVMMQLEELLWIKRRFVIEKERKV